MKIKELFTDESKWTKGSNAKNKDGRPVPVHSPEAVCFCLEGALFYCYPLVGDRIPVREMIRLTLPLNHYSMILFNDNAATTFADIKALVEQADV